MTNAHQWLADASSWFWPAMADHLWQSTIFALMIIAACYALRRSPARLRHTFYLLASVKFLIPISVLALLAQQAGAANLPFLRASEQRPESALIQQFSEPVSTLAVSYQITTVATASHTHNELYCALSILWFIGCATVLLVWVKRRRTFLRSLKKGRTVLSGREWLALEHARDLLRWRDPVQLIICSSPIEPGVWRVWKPVMLLPETIANHLDDDELEAIMLHELIHIRQRDNFISNLQHALCSLFWFHPLVWVISRKVFDEREQACDERVIGICRTPEAYASSILKVVRFCFGWKMAGVTGAGSGSNLRRRIENIMSMSLRNSESRAASVAIRAFAIAIVSATLLVLLGSGVYSRTHGANAISGNDETLNNASELNSPAPAADGVSGEKKRGHPAPPPPPPPPADPQINVPPSHAKPPQPPQPDTPPTPPLPETPASEASAVEPASKTKPKQKIVKGALIEAPHPVYPDEAKKQNVEGTVTVAITINEEGNVISAEPTGGPQMLYDTSKEAAFKARFKPTLVNGKPAKVSGALTYNFVLSEKTKSKQ